VAERFSCARTSADLREPLSGTASQVRRWVLVEQPGSWGADAIAESRLPPSLGEQLRHRSREVGARPLLIRRPGRETGPRQVIVASSRPGAAWAERVELDRIEDLAELDLAPLARDASVGGTPLDASLLLTCTNGSHDACCAEYGRGVAAALAASHGERAWECSHIGGDRFAANVLVLPEGIYYGRVTPEGARGIVDLHDAGRLSLPHLRGRSTARFDVQAAESLLRAHLDADGIDDVVPVARRATGEAGVEVELEVLVPDLPSRWLVEIEVAPDPREQLLTCGATAAGFPPRYAERRIEPVPGGEAGAPRSTSPG
jgi:hypothetical protein